MVSCVLLIVAVTVRNQQHSADKVIQATRLLVEGGVDGSSWSLSTAGVCLVYTDIAEACNIRPRFVGNGQWQCCAIVTQRKITSITHKAGCPFHRRRCAVSLQMSSEMCSSLSLVSVKLCHWVRSWVGGRMHFNQLSYRRSNAAYCRLTNETSSCV